MLPLPLLGVRLWVSDFTTPHRAELNLVGQSEWEWALGWPHLVRGRTAIPSTGSSRYNHKGMDHSVCVCVCPRAQMYPHVHFISLPRAKGSVYQRAGWVYSCLMKVMVMASCRGLETRCLGSPPILPVFHRNRCHSYNPNKACALPSYSNVTNCPIFLLT